MWLVLSLALIWGGNPFVLPCLGDELKSFSIEEKGDAFKEIGRVKAVDDHANTWVGVLERDHAQKKFKFYATTVLNNLKIFRQYQSIEITGSMPYIVQQHNSVTGQQDKLCGERRFEASIKAKENEIVFPDLTYRHKKNGKEFWLWKITIVADGLKFGFESVQAGEVYR